MIYNYDDYIFEQKLDYLFSNINESSYTSEVWTKLESKIPKSNKFWVIVNGLSNNYKRILGVLLNKSLSLIDNISVEQANKLLNKIFKKIYQIIKPDSIRKKLIYSILIFITSFTLLSMTSISISDSNIRGDVKDIVSEMPIKTIDNIPTNVATPSIMDTTKREVVIRKSQKEFLTQLAFKESTNIWNKIRYVKRNKDGKTVPAYVGKYQFGNIAFKDIGKNFTVTDFENDPSIWPEDEQDKDILKLLKKNAHYMRHTVYFKGMDHYIGKTINGIEMTEAGILAASHLVGSGSVRKFLRSNGEKNQPDGNGTTCADYMKEFSNYKLEI